MPIQIGNMELYDVQELSGLLDVQERTIRRYLREGKLKGRKMAKKWYVTEASLRAYFEGQETGLPLFQYREPQKATEGAE